MELFEFEVHVASNDDLKRGVTAREIVKVLVADTDSWAAYKVAVAMMWPEETDDMVTACWWVP